MKIGVVLPTYNEEKAIGSMIEKVKEAGRFSIYVVDGGSKDKTAEIAEKHGAKVIQINRRGKGVAIKEAFQIINDDYIIMLDADQTYDARDIPRFVSMLKGCDVAFGSRFRGKMEPGSMSFVNKTGNLFLTLFANLLYGKKCSDLCTGYWGFTKHAYKGMDIDAKHFELEANFYVESALKNFELCEIPIEYKRRLGDSKISVGDGIKIGFYLLKSRFKR